MKEKERKEEERKGEGQGRAGQGRAGQGRAGQSRAELPFPFPTTLTMKFTYLQLCQDTPVLLNYTGSGEEFQQQCLLNILKIPRVW